MSAVGCSGRARHPVGARYSRPESLYALQTVGLRFVPDLPHRTTT